MSLKKRKNEVREQIRELNSDFDYFAYMSYSKVIVDRLSSLEEFKEATNVLLFSSLMDEPHLKELIFKALDMKKNVALPLSDPQKSKLEFLQIDQEWEKNSTINSWGIIEPSKSSYTPIQLKKNEASIIVVPAMAYSVKKERLGRGKGFYDRFLAKNKFLFSIGVCFEHQLFDSLPKGFFDINVDMVLTPSAIY